MSFQELLAKVTACPLRPAPLAEVQARLAKLTNQVADPFHTLLTRVALHDTTGVVWKSWELAGTPKLKPGAICLGNFPEGAPVWHALTPAHLGKTTLSTFGEEIDLGPFYRFVTVTSDVGWNAEPKA